MSEKMTVIDVELLGQRLPLRTPQSPEEVNRVVEALRSRIEQIQKGAGAIDTLRLALLAALDLSRELLAIQDELAEVKEEATERTLALLERVESETTFDG